MSTREITDHHDGHGLNESIVIEANAPGPGGASHEYKLLLDVHEVENLNREIKSHMPEMITVAEIQFQKGPRLDATSSPGVTDSAVLAVVIDRLKNFQAGEYSCRENAIALTHLETALLWMKKRADERAKRGVLGTYAK